MSRTVSAALVGVVGAVNRLQPSLQRGKTIANVISALETQSLRSVDTPHGPLRFLTGRGRHVGGAVDNFTGNEPETLAWIDGLPKGDVLWDVGAAFGQFSLYAARRGLRVIAFEPKATSYGLLVEHVALNGLGERVTPLCLALSDRTGRTALQLSGLDAGGALNTLLGSQTSAGSTPDAFLQPVHAVRADEALGLYDLPRPQHVKLDVDGVEAAILEAAPEVLQGVQTLLVEVEGVDLERTAARIDAALTAAGLHEDRAMRAKGSSRNRLYTR